MSKSSPARQRGGFILGLILGLLIGLALALGVALYIAKVPIPFIDKLPQRSAAQDAAEAERNKNWDPNAGLNGHRGGAAAASKPATDSAPTLGAPVLPKAEDKAVVVAPGAKPGTLVARDPAAILSSQKPAAGAASSAAAPEAFVYFVQAGAYGRTEDAEQQRAKLALAGFESKLTEREQGGRTVYRVRMGPYEKRSDAESTQDRLAGNGIEAALVRVQK
jgi:cell division protein FtsN